MGIFSSNAADVSSSTGDSSSQAAHAAHVARDDATKDSVFERGNSDLNSVPFSKLDGCNEASNAAQGFWSSIFGR